MTLRTASSAACTAASWLRTGMGVAPLSSEVPTARRWPAAVRSRSTVRSRGSGRMAQRSGRLRTQAWSVECLSHQVVHLRLRRVGRVIHHVEAGMMVVSVRHQRERRTVLAVDEQNDHLTVARACSVVRAGILGIRNASRRAQVERPQHPEPKLLQSIGHPRGRDLAVDVDGWETVTRIHSIPFVSILAWAPPDGERHLLVCGEATWPIGPGRQPAHAA